MTRARAIADDVLAVLSAGLADGDRYYLPQRQLDRKLYERTNDVLAALGGRWNRKAKAHVFDHACEDVIEGAIETGEFTRPADMGWFPTPPELAARIVDMAGVQPGHTVLEPSAGEGAIATIAAARGADVYAIEIDSARFAVLASMGFWVAQLVDAFTERRADLDWDAPAWDALNSEIAALTTLIDEGKLQLPEDTIAGNLGGILALYGDLLPPDARAALLFATAFVNEMAELGAEVDQSAEAQQLLAGATRH